MMRIRDKLFGKLKKSKNDSIIYLYKKFRNRVSEALKQSKTRYFHNLFSEEQQ